MLALLFVAAVMVAIVVTVRSITDRAPLQAVRLRPVVLPGGARLELVGESHYQRALEGIAGKRTDESKRVEVLATLVPEPDNRYDTNAVAVYIETSLVGYLARADAVEFQPFLMGMRARGDVAMCNALIVGGWDRGSRGRGRFGVKLDVRRPSATEDMNVMASEAETRPFDMTPILAKLRSAAGPAARRALIAKVVEHVSERDRQAFLLEASRIEVDAVLAKVSGLKTAAAKRRNLEAALKALEEDDVSDELQAQQMAWLKQALTNLDRT